MDFKLAPALIAMMMAFLVRIPLIKPKGRVLSEFAYTIMGMTGAFVTIMDRNAGPFLAFWIGLVFGALASSLAEISKSAMWGGIQERLQGAAKVLFGLSEKGN